MAEGSIKRIHMPLFIDLYLGSLHQIYDSRATVKHQLPLGSCCSPSWIFYCSALPLRNGRSLEMMHWIYLSLAILFEVAGTLNMKLSEGFSKPLPSVLLVVFYICSLSFLTLSLKQIEISVAYAIWSGLGIMIITLIGYMFLRSRLTGLRFSRSC